MYNQYKICVYEKHTPKKEKLFMEKYHYSGNIPRNGSIIFSLYVEEKLMGVAIFGCPVSAQAKKLYAGGKDLLELRRFALHPERKKNTASWFLSKCLHKLKELKKYHSVLSYADPQYNHIGTIYKASNFKYIGKQKMASQVYKIDGKIIHSRAAHQKGTKTETLIKQLGVSSVCLPKKHIYLYKLENK